ncbi:MAG: hypothetical protein Kilf2KO_11370 [Rhodospirillales bacterium]
MPRWSVWYLVPLAVFLAAAAQAEENQAEKTLDCVGQPDQTAIGFTTICAGDEAFTAEQLEPWTCDELWNLRNNILYTEGYCFESARAKAAFDDVGCSAHSLAAVPLNRFQRENVDLISKLEAQKACPAD